jgi:hypothetical protein
MQNESHTINQRAHDRVHGPLVYSSRKCTTAPGRDQIRCLSIDHANMQAWDRTWHLIRSSISDQ